MKKLLIVLLAITVMGILAYADDMAPAPAAPVVTIGDWGKQILAFGNTDNNSGTGYQFGLGTSWGSTPRIVGLQISAHNANAGFAISPDADNGSFGLTDENKAWVSPLPGLTFESGITLETDTWRGITDYAADDWIRYPGIGVSGNTTTFFRLGEGGYMSDLNYNMNGIGLWYGLANPAAPVTGNGVPATDIAKSTQAGAAYTIAGIGMIKAQWYGLNVATGNGNFGAPTGANTINAAFNLSAVKGLYEEIAILYPTSDVGYSIEVMDDIGYTMAPLAIHARVEAVSYDGNVAKVSGLGLTGNVAVDYDLGNGLGAEAAVDYSNATQVNSGVSTGGTALTGVLVDIKKSFSNGWIGIGFQYTSINFGGGNLVGTPAYSHWAIPIAVSEWF